MKLFSEHSKRRQSDDNVIPLINVVFLMLIFFMLAGQISATDAFPVSVPISEREQAASLSEREILMSANGELALDNQPHTLETLEHALRSHLQIEPLSLVLKVDADTTAAQVRPLLQMLTAAEVKHLRLYTQRPGTQTPP